ncbi:MAG: DUF5597 domain-containing protein [Clostridiales bacterium]|nr:DUF5597 domain-containing protein [Clostridiales bacterium]
MSMPRVEVRNGQKVLLVDDKPFIMLSGELHNSSSSTLKYMEPIWDKMQSINVNSIVFPVTWQQTEPVEGEFHFELVDGLIEQAKAHGMKFGILWFGAWKNANCSYAPNWVKLDTKRFWRAQGQKGKNVGYFEMFGHKMPYTTLSAFCEETNKADAKAFAALCKHLKEVDTDHTVIVIQVENETGMLGTSRDHSDVADAIFASQVPKELVEGLVARKEGLVEDIKEALDKCQSGTWEEVFGEAADEVFMAYHTAKYIENVAAAGKAEYPLPMYANCWLVQGGKPGRYPSGGPVYRVLEVYQTVAPSLDWLAPDIYIPQFVDTCKKYTKQGNPLFIPEIAMHGGAPARLIYAVGHHHVLCFAPFGIDDIGTAADTFLGAAVGMDTSDEDLRKKMEPETYARVNALIQGLVPVLGDLYGTDQLDAVIKEDPDRRTMNFGDVAITGIFENPMMKSGAGALLAARVAPDTFYLLGTKCMPSFTSLDPEKPFFEYLTIEEGEFIDGTWTVSRLLNGDEEHVRFGEPTLLKVEIHLFD